jgi:hypothetical protein
MRYVKKKEAFKKNQTGNSINFRFPHLERTLAAKTVG